MASDIQVLAVAVSIESAASIDRGSQDRDAVHHDLSRPAARHVDSARVVVKKLNVRQNHATDFLNTSIAGRNQLYSLLARYRKTGRSMDHASRRCGTLAFVRRPVW